MSYLVTNRKIVLAVGAVVTVLLANAWVNYRNTQQLDDEARWVAHSHEFLEATEALLGTLTDAETGQRGFLLTGDTRFLEPYEQATSNYAGELERVKTLSEDNPRQQARVDRLKGLADARLAILARLLAVYQHGDPAAARKAVQSGDGKRIMDDIRAVAGEMEDEERGLLLDRKALRRRAYATAVTSGVLTLLAGLTAVGVAVWFVGRSLRDRGRAINARQQHALIQSIVAGMGDGVIVTDIDGRVTLLNRVAEQLTGWGQSEAAGLPIEEVFRIINIVSRQPVQNPARRAMELGHVVLLENNTALLSKGGTEWPVDDSAAPITDEAGTHVGAVLVFREITERRKAERALEEANIRREQLLVAVQESEGYLRSVLDNSPDCIKVLDTEGRLLDMNRPGRCAMEIDSFDPFVGSDWPTIWPEPGRNFARAAVESARRGEVSRFEGLCPTGKGTLKVWDVRVAPIPGPDGPPARLVSVSRDVTHETRAVNALRECEEKFRRVVDELAEGVVLLDQESRLVIQVNRAFLTLLGYAAGEVDGLTQYDFVAHDRADIDAKMAAVAERGQFALGFRKYRRKDGSIVDVSVSGSLLNVGGRSVLCLTVRDMTAEKSAEDALRESEERFQSFMENTPALAYMKDENGKFVFVNGPACRRFDIPESGWLGRSDSDLWGHDVARSLREIDLKVLESGEMVKVVEKVPTPDRKSEYWQSYKFRFAGRAGRRLLAGISVDITAEKRAEDALREKEEKYRQVLDGLAEGVCVIELGQMTVVEANGTFLQLVNYTVGEIATLTLYDFLMVDRTVIDGEIKLVLEHGQYKLGRRQVRRKDGSVVDVEVSVSHVAGGRRMLAVVVRDMTEQKASEDRLFEYQLELEEANAKLRAMAVTDGLTGVRNRAAFDGKLAEEYDRAVRYHHPLSVVIMDVDYFKLFNDTFGHPAGDEVLKAVARTLGNSARNTDFVARYGGEEFVVVLPDTDFSGAMVVAERFRRAIAGVQWDKRPITVSVGVATLSKTTADAETLVQEADRALYQSKKAGRNRVSHGSGIETRTSATRVPS